MTLDFDSHGHPNPIANLFRLQPATLYNLVLNPGVWVCVKWLQSCLTLCDPTDSSHQAPLSIRFSRKDYWNGLPCPPLGNLPNLGIEHASLAPPALAGRFFTTSTTWEAPLKPGTWAIFMHITCFCILVFLSMNAKSISFIVLSRIASLFLSWKGKQKDFLFLEVKL